MPKFVYDFSEGNKDLKDLLGGKGANLAEMTNLGLPVPPGCTRLWRYAQPEKPCPVRGAHARECPVHIAGIQEPEPVTGSHALVQPVRYIRPCFDARVSLYQHAVDEVHASRIDGGLKLLAESPYDRAHHAGHLLRYRPSRVTVYTPIFQAGHGELRRAGWPDNSPESLSQPEGPAASPLPLFGVHEIPSVFRRAH